MFNKKIMLILAALICLTGCSSVGQNTDVELKDDMGALTISKAGSYVISGSTNNGSIIVDADDEDEITLILDGATINAEATAAIYVKKAKNVTVVLDENTTNTLTSTGKFEKDGDIKVDGVIFSKADLVVEGNGTLNVECETSHGIVSKDSLIINSGNYIISAEKKGISVNDDIVVNGGIIDITKSYEGIEGEIVTINDGTINIIASDDGINAAGDSDSNEKGGMMDTDSNAYININGGSITIDSGGDGIDSNGYLNVSGGTLYINGPTDNGNGSLDYGIDANITGGTVIATGMSGMAQNFSDESTQCAALVNIDSVMEAGTQIKLMDSAGNVLLEYTSTKKYNSVVLSCDEMKTGETYTLVTGDVTTEFEMTDVIYGNGMGVGRGNFGGFNRGEPHAMPDGEERTIPQDIKNGERPQMPNMPDGETPTKK